MASTMKEAVDSEDSQTYLHRIQSAIDAHLQLQNGVNDKLLPPLLTELRSFLSLVEQSVDDLQKCRNTFQVCINEVSKMLDASKDIVTMLKSAGRQSVVCGGKFESHNVLFASILEPDGQSGITNSSLAETIAKQKQKMSPLFVEAHGSYFCAICDNQFSTYGIVEDHIQIFHPLEYSNIFQPTCNDVVMKREIRRPLCEDKEMVCSNVLSTVQGASIASAKNTCIVPEAMEGNIGNNPGGLREADVVLIKQEKGSCKPKYRGIYYEKIKKSFVCLVCTMKTSKINSMYNHIHQCHIKEFGNESSDESASSAYKVNGRTETLASIRRKSSRVSSLKNDARTDSRKQKRKELRKRRYSQYIGEGNRCKACNKQLSSRRILLRHISTVHLFEKPYKCDLCSKEFTAKATRDEHVNVIHKNIRKHKCHICCKTYAYRYSLVAHKITAHSVPKSKSGGKDGKIRSRKT